MGAARHGHGIAAILLCACAGAQVGTPVADSEPTSRPTARVAAPQTPPARPGVRHPAAESLAKALEASDATAAAAAFDENGVLARYHAEDARGRAAVERSLRIAMDLCKMRVASVIEREASFMMQIESTCTHESSRSVQAHLVAAEVVGDSIARASVLTELLPFHDREPATIRELEAPETLTTERARAARCQIDHFMEMLPKEFRGASVDDVWATQSCTVLHVRGADPSRFHGYVEVDCGKPIACRPSSRAHRYVDWNGLRLLPFADGSYRAERNGSR